MNTEPRKEHEWIQKLVGEWTYEVEHEDRRLLTSHLRGKDGNWYRIMKADYRRKKEL